MLPSKEILAAIHITFMEYTTPYSTSPSHAQITDWPKAAAHRDLGLGIALVGLLAHILQANSFATFLTWRFFWEWRDLPHLGEQQ